MNKEIWELYKNSERGKEIIDIFTYTDNEYIDTWAERIFTKYIKYFGAEDMESYGGKEVLQYCSFNFTDAYFNLIADNLILPDNVEITPEYFLEVIDNLEISTVEQGDDKKFYKKDNRTIFIRKGDYRSLTSILSEISLVLFFIYPEEFFPMLFREEFDVFIKSMDVLNIPFPELPAKSNKRGRLLFYNELNNNIIEFSHKNNLTPEEACACIYDFALMLINNKKDEPLPPPTNVWLTGGSKGDYKAFLENPIKGQKSVWTCNENTKRGDIIVMYVLSPYSCIQSIWRADIDGVYTPFNYYNSRTKATNGVITPHITIKELKKDKYFSKLPITRRNFQGVNGVRLTANDYQELLKRFQSKGFDTSILPQLYTPNLNIDLELDNENDVEEKLLIPLLNNLGFTDKDWSRQISQKTGTNTKAIPDFVFLAKGEKYFQNAPMVIEAKYDMNSNLEQIKAFNQALSYARMMKSSYLGICDKERLIIFKEKNGSFDRFSPVFENYWENINDKEVFRKIKLIIGKEIINTASL